MARKTPGAGESDPARWRREAERLRPLEDAHLTLGIDAVKVYLGTLGCVWWAAHHPVRRGGDGPLRPFENGSAAGSYQSEEEGAALGTRRPIMESKPPQYSPAAMALLKAEQRHLQARERMLMKKLGMILYPEDYEKKDAA